MKKIFILIIGIIIGLTTGIMGATYIYHAGEVSYSPSNSNFNVDNVEDAINELYSNYSNLQFKEIIIGRYSSGYRVTIINENGYWTNWNSSGTPSNISEDAFQHVTCIENVTGSYWVSATVKRSGYFVTMTNNGNPTYYNVGDTITGLGGQNLAFIIYFGEINPLS